MLLLWRFGRDWTQAQLKWSQLNSFVCLGWREKSENGLRVIIWTYYEYTPPARKKGNYGKSRRLWLCQG